MSDEIIVSRGTKVKIETYNYRGKKPRSSWRGKVTGITDYPDDPDLVEIIITGSDPIRQRISLMGARIDDSKVITTSIRHFPVENGRITKQPSRRVVRLNK